MANTYTTVIQTTSSEGMALGVGPLYVYLFVFCGLERLGNTQPNQLPELGG